jgi:hypothetical protein
LDEFCLLCPLFCSFFASLFSATIEEEEEEEGKNQKSKIQDIGCSNFFLYKKKNILLKPIGEFF